MTSKLTMLICLISTAALAQDAGFPSDCKVQALDGGVTATCGDVGGAAWLMPSGATHKQVAELAVPAATAKLELELSDDMSGPEISSRPYRLSTNDKMGWVQLLSADRFGKRGIYCISTLTAQQAGGETMRTEKARARCKPLLAALAATKLERFTPPPTTHPLTLSDKGEVLVNRKLLAPPKGCENTGGTPVTGIKCADTILTFKQTMRSPMKMMETLVTQKPNEVKKVPCEVVGIATSCFLVLPSLSPDGATWMMTAEAPTQVSSTVWTCSSKKDPRIELTTVCALGFKMSGSDVPKPPAK